MSMSRIVLVVGFLGVAVVATAGVSVLGGATSDRQPERLGQIIINADNLETARNLAEFFKERERQMREFVPVGTIIAFAATVDPKHPPQGWLVCNGDAFDALAYSELAALLPAGKDKVNRVPDLRGMFLRGMDMDRGIDPDGKSRQVGDQQAWTTGLPKKKFETTANGEHTHNYAATKVVSGNWQSGGSGKPSGNDTSYTGTTAGAGGHDHDVTKGGDLETRPVNVGVIYLIRCN